MRIQTIMLFSLTAILLTQTACVSMSALQTAEALEKGATQTTFGGGVYESDATDEENNVTAKLNVPYVEASYREGLGNKWDVGAKLTLIGSAVVDAKYQFLDMDKLDGAVGLGVGYMTLEETVGEEKVKTRFIDAMVPFYLSYKFTPAFSAYTSPRFVYRTISSGDDQSLAGAAAGVKVGKDWGAYLEAGYQKELGGDFSAIQYNVSFFSTGSSGLLASLGL